MPTLKTRSSWRICTTCAVALCRRFLKWCSAWRMWFFALRRRPLQAFSCNTAKRIAAFFAIWTACWCLDASRSLKRERLCRKKATIERRFFGFFRFADRIWWISWYLRWVNLSGRLRRWSEDFLKAESKSWEWRLWAFWRAFMIPSRISLWIYCQQASDPFQKSCFRGRRRRSFYKWACRRVVRLRKSIKRITVLVVLRSRWFGCLRLRGVEPSMSRLFFIRREIDWLFVWKWLLEGTRRVKIKCEKGE